MKILRIIVIRITNCAAWPFINTTRKFARKFILIIWSPLASPGKSLKSLSKKLSHKIYTNRWQITVKMNCFVMLWGIFVAMVRVYIFTLEWKGILNQYKVILNQLYLCQTTGCCIVNPQTGSNLLTVTLTCHMTHHIVENLWMEYYYRLEDISPIRTEMFIQVRYNFIPSELSYQGV